MTEPQFIASVKALVDRARTQPWGTDARLASLFLEGYVEIAGAMLQKQGLDASRASVMRLAHEYMQGLHGAHGPSNGTATGAEPPALASAATPAMREIIKEFVATNGRPPGAWTELGDYLLEAGMAFYLKDAHGNQAQVAQHLRQLLPGFGIQL